ncbi:MAG: hypothetical protein QM535_05770 [Limnohabitans sp.]|nr:hypothetical protein [Limnohabitans sp.]
MKKVLLVMADFMEFNTLIEKELKEDFEVFTLTYPLTNTKFKYKNVFQKIENLYRKTILKDKNFKVKLRNEQNNEVILKELDGYPFFDYTLVLNVEYFNNKTLDTIKSKSKKMIAYQWDGLQRTPEIYSKIKYFEKFYCFNPNDVDNKTIFFASNFYFDIPLQPNTEANTSDVYYIGKYLEDRVNPIIPLFNVFEKYDFTGELLFNYDGDCATFKKLFPHKIVKCTKTPIAYKENLEKMNASKAVLDLKLKEHDGLSFRFFEAMKYQKKIITTNTTVKKYDFYLPENTFIFGEDNLEELPRFINSKYVPITEDILKKYSFKIWFKNLINE